MVFANKLALVVLTTIAALLISLFWFELSDSNEILLVEIGMIAIPIAALCALSGLIQTALTANSNRWLNVIGSLLMLTTCFPFTFLFFVVGFDA